MGDTGLNKHFNKPRFNIIHLYLFEDQEISMIKYSIDFIPSTKDLIFNRLFGLIGSLKL